MSFFIYFIFLPLVFLFFFFGFFFFFCWRRLHLTTARDTRSVLAARFSSRSSIINLKIVLIWANGKRVDLSNFNYSSAPFHGYHRSREVTDEKKTIVLGRRTSGLLLLLRFFYSFSFLSFLFSASFSFPVIFFSSLLPSFLSFFLPNEIPTTPVRYPVYNWLASVPSITFRLDCRSRLRFSNGAGANEKKEKRKNERKKEREKENWKGRGSLLLLLITRLIFVWTFYSLCLCRYFTQFSITGGYGGGSDGGGVPP